MMGFPSLRVYDPGQIGMGGESNMVYIQGVEQMDDGVLFRFKRHLEDDENLNYMWGSDIKDINDVEIFQGDIVEYNFGTDGSWITGIVRAEVIFERGMFLIDSPFFDIQDFKVKIVGNIYENPELLSK